MKIRKATVDDIDSLIKLRLDFMKDEEKELPPYNLVEFTENKEIVYGE